MLFDTDVLIWVQRGNSKAASLVDNTEERFISVQTYMELLQGARSREQHGFTKDFLKEYGFITLPFSPHIGHRASIYMEEYALSSGLRAGDAIVAATAVENRLILSTGNQKHFRDIKDLQFEIFPPE
jgi:predicted nucleic acid-binding protein